MQARSPEESGLQVAIITGQHTFDVPAFFGLLRSIPTIDLYPQQMENYVADLGQARDWYDAVVFYNYHQTIAEDGPGAQMKEALEELGHSEQGIVLWHHGLVAFPCWQRWADLSGIKDRTFAAHVGQTIQVQVADPGHPIVQGLSDWEMVDETYDMKAMPTDSNVLLTTDHSLSMRAIAWTKQYGRARVFCYQSGHDRQAYASPNFRSVLTRGIQWAARSLEG